MESTWIWAILLMAAGGVCAGEELSFNRDIRPILAENCFHCHGPDKGTRFADMRLENRSRFSEYFEVFMDAPIDVLRQRDTKGLYAARDRGQTLNVVGLDIPFEPPAFADMVVDSSGEDPDLEHLASAILGKAIPA